MIAFRLFLLAIAGVSLTLAACGSSSRPNDLTLQNRGFQRLAEMNSEAIAQLDPSRTLFVLPVDPLEAHGPHLPSGTDVFSTEEITQRMASRVAVSLPDWTIVIMPTLSYGVSGANRIADRSDIRGTFSLRATTLRDIVADLGSQVADHGIRWLFVAYIHGAAHHHAALNDAADFVRDAYGVKVVNLGAVEWYLPHPKRDEFLEGHFTPEQRARIGFDIHAGMRETSRIMAIRPDLVSSNVLQLPDRTVRNWGELESFGHTPDFKGLLVRPSAGEFRLWKRCS
jgi:creatinine amidohydrolase